MADIKISQLPAATTPLGGTEVLPIVQGTTTKKVTVNELRATAVTAVTGTAPVVSSGGTTPAISMAAANGSTNGYLTSTDWNTFNSKQPAGSYLTNGGALGTPSSGTATNLTGLPLSTGVTGTLVVANGGTGATTLTGYIKGNGTSAMTASATVPGSDVSGNISGNAANVTGTVAVANGGTGQTTYTDGQLLIGNSSGGLTKATLTQGTNVSIVNGDGIITISATGGSGGGNVTGPASATNNAVVLFDGATGQLIKDSAQTIASANTASTVVARDASGNFSAGTITAALSGNASTATSATTATTATNQSGGTVSATSISDSGNLAFTGTGNRITGDFSNGTVADKVLVQTSSANAPTTWSVIPSGTSTSSFYDAWCVSSGFTNTAYARLGTNGSEVHFQSNIIGTGTYLPMTFYTGGGERVRIDTAGNVGIGTNSPTQKLDVNGVAKLADSGYNYGNIELGRHGTGDRNAYIDFNSSGTPGAIDYSARIIRSPGVNGTWEFSNIGTGSMIFNTGTSERMRIDSSGNVGIGTSSPAANLDVSGSGQTRLRVTSTGTSLFPGLEIKSGTAIPFEITQLSTGEGYIYNGANAAITFSTNATERARITSGGEVYIAGTTDRGAYNLQVNGTGVWGAGAYVNGSDARLKEEVQDLAPALGVVNALRPVTFRYKADYSKDQSIQPGFIAQELQQVLGEQVYVDGVVHADPTHLNVAYQSLIPVLTKAIQEQQAIIDAQQAALTVLTARVAALESN